MAVMDEDLQRLWHLLAELSSQLTQNKEQCEQLKKQAEDLKTQAVHTGTGYALKRFNVDLSKEQFESELERMNAQLVVENQTLQHENRQLTILLKDYETTLEQIMTRFRTHAHSTQQHELDMTKYYESVLLSLLEKQQRTAAGMPSNFSPHEPTSATSLLDPNVFQAIQNISTLIQSAIRDLSGEEPLLEDLDYVSDQVRDLEYLTGTSPPGVEISETSSSEPSESSGVERTLNPAVPNPAQSPLQFKNPFNGPPKSDSGPTPSWSPTAKAGSQPRRSSTSIIDYQPRAQDPSRGGFVGKRSSLSDAALQTAIELERLKKENEQLRELLGIANDINSQAAQNKSLPTSQDAHIAKLNSVVEDVIKEEEEDEEDEEDEEGSESEGEGESFDESHDHRRFVERHSKSHHTSQWSDDDEPIHPPTSVKLQRNSSPDSRSEQALPELSSLSLSDAINPEGPSHSTDENIEHPENLSLSSNSLKPDIESEASVNIPSAPISDHPSTETTSEEPTLDL